MLTRNAATGNNGQAYIGLGHMFFDHRTNEWKTFKLKLNSNFIVGNIIEEDRQKAMLITSLSDDTLSLLESLCVPAEVQCKTFKELILLLDKHFTPVKSYFSARNTFYRAEKYSTETISEWAARVRTLAMPCGFGSELNIVLRDIFTLGLEKNYKERLFEVDAKDKDTTLAKMIDIALAKEMASKNNQQEVNEINYVKHNKSNQRINHRFKNQSNHTTARNQNAQNNKTKCQVCGRINHKTIECKYKEYTCNKCNLKGHLAPMCKKNIVKYKNKSFNTHFINNNNSDTDPENDNIFLNESEIFKINTENNVNDINPIEINVMLDKVKLKFQIDTGSFYSFISESCYFENFHYIKLLDNDIMLKDYIGKYFKPLGKLDISFNYNNVKGIITLYVVKKGGPPLLGSKDFSKLNIFFNHNTINYIKGNDQPNDIVQLCKKYSKVFDNNLGTFSKHKITLFVEKDCIPKFYKPRFVPFAFKNKVELEINRLINMGVLTPVEHSNWATPIVPVLKPDNTVRICGDFSVTLNPVLQGIQHPLPKIDHLFAKHCNNVYFSKIDLKDAYAQLCLSEESQKLVVINTHMGLFAYTRLPYGINCAASTFQRVLEQTIGDMEGVTIFQDDISISGKTRTEHNKRLESVLSKLLDAGLKVKIEKCKFLKTSIEYLGHIIDSRGIHSTDKHIETIKNVPVPTNLTELKSFLGMVTYYLKFIPKSAELLEPLYALTRQEQIFNWSNKCNKVFIKIKNLLLSNRVLANFDFDLPIKLTVDASEKAVGAILSHVYCDNTERPIAFASHLLTKAEQKYPQLEREGLAIIFGVKKFNDYLFGKHFTLVTDNKPIAHILNPGKGIPKIAANRLQRWAYILMAYKFDIKWVPTNSNPADYLSRLVIQNKQVDIEANVNYLNFIKEESNWIIDWKKVKKATKQDPILSKISEFILSNSWPNEANKNLELLPYFRRKDELTIEQNIIMWGYRVIIPLKLRNFLLRQLHESHQGITKMKSLARAYFWWPLLDKEVENLSANCELCITNRANPPKCVLKTFEWPSKAWTRLHIDFLGPINGQTFLVIVDSTSKWIECFKVNSLNTTIVIKKLNEIIARFGIPKAITSDGAKCFTNEYFQSYLRKYNINHLVGAPYHPQSNGAAESAVKIIKNFIKKVIKNNQMNDIINLLNNFLFQYRNTPHTTTGETPTKILFGKSIRFVFDLLKSSTSDVVEKCQTKQVINGGKRDVNFTVNEKVIVRDYRSPSNKWISAVISKILGSRTYEVTTNDNLVWKRHTNQILKNNSSFIENTPITDNNDSFLSDLTIKQSSHIVNNPNSNNRNNIKQRPKRTIIKPLKFRN
ncbi:uncharacterized protein K02A2.6-like [Daktulosphaira vitifoliae]|uniref:uncharacterized protein K02A2.6-like n=1 Tax=Daktulosphaira vitifoliae TaxID=58002 RepID=UPI0021AA4C3E|nr:uncharacterized protein K02A2.6-like [Daktulosphaira vitifoliae]